MRKQEEKLTDYCLRMMVAISLYELSKELDPFEEADVSGLAEEHKIGYKSGYRRAMEDARMKINQMCSDL